MQDSPKNTILVIDDEQGVRDLVKYLLEPLGYVIEMANDGFEGLEKIKKKDFDLVLLDVHMPKMTGPETLDNIKAIKPKQKVLIFSSSSDPQFVFESTARSRGAMGCLYKPFDMNELIATIENALKTKE